MDCESTSHLNLQINFVLGKMVGPCLIGLCVQTALLMS